MTESLRRVRMLVLIGALACVLGPHSAWADAFTRGERAVTKNATRVMEGETLLGTAPAGSEFSIEKVSDGGGWVLGTFTLNGRKVSGWVNTTDLNRAAVRPAPAAPAAPAVPAAPPAAAPVRNDMATFQQMEANYNRLIVRYDRKYDLPATLYGFLPIRQGMTETVTPDVIARNRYAVGDYVFARFPFDPVTVREAETTRLLQSLPKAPELGQILDRCMELAQRPAMPDAVERPVPAPYAQLLDRLARDLYTDAYAQTQSLLRQSETARGADHPETMTAYAWELFIRRMHGGLEVETRHHRVLNWATQKYGAGHELTTRAWNNLALVRHDRGDFEAARLLLIHALHLRSQQAQGASADVVLLLLNLDRVLESEGRIADAARCSRAARSLTRALPEPIRRRIAATAFDEFAETQIPETAGAPFYLRSGVPYRPSVANFSGFGGGNTRRDGNETVSSGFDAINMTLLVGSQAGAGGYPHTGYMLAAAHYSRQRDLASAERFQRKAIEVARRSFQNRPELHWHITMNMQALAETLRQIGNFDGAIEVLRDAIKLQYPLWDKEWRAGQAAFAGGQGEYFDWSAYTNYAPLLLLYAKMHAELGRLDDAERLYRDALIVADMPTRIDRRPMTLNLSQSPQCRVELADVLLRRGKVPEAEALYRGVLTESYSRWCFALMSRVSATPALTGLASILKSRGGDANLVSATQMVHDAYLIPTFGTSVKEVGYAHTQLMDYARSLRDAGKLAEAALLLQRSIEQVERFRRDVGGDELNRARYFSELTRTAPHSVLAQIYLTAGRDFGDHFGVGEFGPGAAFDALELGRGRALLDLMNRGGGDVGSAALMTARRRNDPALLDRVQQIQARETAARNKVAQLIDQGATTSSTAEIPRLQAQLDAARGEERQASRELFDIARELLESNAIAPLNWKQASAALGADEALLTYDIGEDRSLVLVVKPDGNVEGQMLTWPDGKPVTGASLQAASREFFLEVSREQPPENAAVQEAYSPAQLRAAILPDAIWQTLKGRRRLYVVADGPLHQVPLESLFLDDDGDGILIDEAPPMVYGPSATMLLSPRRRPDTPPPAGRLELLALGDPQFVRAEGSATAGTSVSAPAAERTRTLSRFGTLAPLPGTRAELQVIRVTVEQAGQGAPAPIKTLSGSDATVTNLFEAAAQPRFLHIATHGLAEGGRRAFDSALALAAPVQVTAGDVGFLRLSDLLTRWGGKLSGTELVVLSACRTARGEMEAGDGFVALTWGFLFAGSPSVVASLWEVDDNATALLMSRLYENLLGSFSERREIAGQIFESGKPLPAAVALLEAKRWLRGLTRAEAQAVAGRMLGAEATVPSGDRPYSDPFYWAAFVLIGDERADKK